MGDRETVNGLCVSSQVVLRKGAWFQIFEVVQIYEKGRRIQRPSHTSMVSIRNGH